MLIVCALLIAFQAGVGFLLGQLFAGHFTFAATLIGVAGLACSAGAVLLAPSSKPSVPWVRWAALATLVGVALDIATYYIYLAIPGNYYPWFLVAPFSLCVAWVGYTAHKRDVAAARC